MNNKENEEAEQPKKPKKKKKSKKKTSTASATPEVANSQASIDMTVENENREEKQNEFEKDPTVEEGFNDLIKQFLGSEVVQNHF